jgi:ACS family hexuronate transporter-like MFS transporter
MTMTLPKMTSRFLREWAPTASMMLVSVVSYVDRNTLAILAPTILGELHLSAEQYGWMISCFSVTYTLGNPLWGAALDRIGLRRGMLAAVAVWTLASASHALVSSFAGFALARALLGFGEGATFPAGLRAAAQTLPESKRGRGIALAYSGGSLGAIVAPLVVTPVAAAWGWRGAFLATGALGVAWLAQWLVLGRDPRLERHDVAAVGEEARVRIGDRRLWAFIAVYALGGLPLGFALYDAPLYLSAALGQSQASIGKLLWLPPFAWEVGYFVFGWLLDRGRAKGAGPLAFRPLLAFLTLLVLPLASAPYVPGLAAPLALFSLATFASAGFILVGVAYAAAAFSARDTALIAGIGAGSWSAFVAVVMPLFGRLFDLRAYPYAFALAAVAPLVGYVAWLGIDGTSARGLPAAVE